MAKYFPPDWKDITVAFPVNILELDTIQELVDSGVTLNLLAENTEALDYLEEHLNGTVGFYLKIDVGYGRTGIPATDLDRIHSILTRSETCLHMTFLGFLTHS
jgi:alanine racemase